MRRAWVGGAVALTLSGCGAKSAPATAASPSGTLASTNPTPVSGPVTITYRWGGGFSMYQFYELSITGEQTAQVKFTVKPVRGDLKTVNDSLDAAQFSELKRLFDQVDFDHRVAVERKGMVMDIGQITIKREQGGASHEVTTGPRMTVDQDIAPLSKWFDDRIRLYLAKAGATAQSR